MTGNLSCHSEEERRRISSIEVEAKVKVEVELEVKSSPQMTQIGTDY
ncbi:MAG: hypothetical protein JG782_1516 [Anaerophaga sp.]|nr:hypothetical protein [Anaerophaga sp.]